MKATADLCFLLLSMSASGLVGAEPATGDAQLLAEVQAAFQQEPAQLLAPVVIFPTVDLSNQIRPGGLVLSRLAQYKLAYAPRRRMAISMNHLTDQLLQNEITAAGAVLGDKEIKDSIVALAARSYVVPRLVEAANGWTLTLDLHEADSDTPRQITHQLSADELPRVPGLIATEVLKQSGVEISAEEQTSLAIGAFQDEADLVFLDQVIRDGFSDRQDEQRLRQFLKQYPTNVVGWEARLRKSDDPAGVLEEYDLQRHAVECERLEIEAAITERDLARPRDALLRLLPLAPTQHGEVYYYATLSKTAFALGDNSISKLVLSTWKEVGKGYLDCCLRGEFFVDWAWQARGGGWAAEVEPEAWELYDKRIRAARAELEQAVVVNPNGFGAHTQLIGVAKAMSLPYDYMNEHFEAAIRARPTHRPAYVGKLEFLRLRWGGTPEQLIAFGQECLATGQWEDGIPPLFIDAIADAYWSLDHSDYDATAFQDDQLWQLIKSYYEAAQEHGNPVVKRRALNFFVLWGALGGKYADVRPAFDHLYIRRHYEENELDHYVFFDTATFLLLHELVLAHADESQTGRLAAVKVALLENRFHEATDLLDNFKPNDWGSTANVQQYRRSLALGLELEQRGRLQLEGRHLQHAFDWFNVDQTGSVPGQAEGRQFTWTPEPTVGHWNDLRLACPVGVRTASWSGELAWTSDVNYFGLTWRLTGSRQQMKLRCYPETSQMMLTEDHMGRYEARLPPSPLRFEIQIGNRGDVIKINDDILWELELPPPSPGLFTIDAMTRGPAIAPFTISNLQVTTPK